MTEENNKDYEKLYQFMLENNLINYKGSASWFLTKIRDHDKPKDEKYKMMFDCIEKIVINKVKMSDKDNVFDVLGMLQGLIDIVEPIFDDNNKIIGYGIYDKEYSKIINDIMSIC